MWMIRGLSGELLVRAWMARWMAPWCEPLLGEASVAPHGCAPGVQKVAVTTHVFERTCVGALQAHVALGTSSSRAAAFAAASASKAYASASPSASARSRASRAIRACRARRRRSDSQGR